MSCTLPKEMIKGPCSPNLLCAPRLIFAQTENRKIDVPVNHNATLNNKLLNHFKTKTQVRKADWVIIGL